MQCRAAKWASYCKQPCRQPIKQRAEPRDQSRRNDQQLWSCTNAFANIEPFDYLAERSWMCASRATPQLTEGAGLPSFRVALLQSCRQDCAPWAGAVRVLKSHLHLVLRPWLQARESVHASTSKTPRPRVPASSSARRERPSAASGASSVHSASAPDCPF
eukprot:COSAG03_NODE_9711_length_698_cov_1.128548_2_plen_159_part_01